MIHTIANIATAIVAAIHVYIMYLEMFLWTKQQGRKAFGLSQEFAEQTKVLGANQGLYNGFLAAGLTWGLIADNFHVKIFFLTCVLIAGLYGAATASKKILYIQALPALIALVLLHIR